MPRLITLCPSLLWFLAAAAPGGCGPTANPVLQVELAGISQDTGKIDIIVTANGKSGTAFFLRDGGNRFVITNPPPGVPGAMPSTVVAVDLPLSTSGPVLVRAETRPVMAMMAPPDLGTMGPMEPPPPPPQATAGTCNKTAAIVPGTLTKVALVLMMPPPPASAACMP